MTELNQKSVEREAEQIISFVLIAGVCLSALTVFIGGALYLRTFGLKTIHQCGSFNFHSLSDVMAQLVTLNPLGIIELGLLLLIATPVARVAFALSAFALAKDRLYIIVSTIVLVTLCYSIFVSQF